MNPFRSRSLRAHLIVRLVLLQAVALLGLAVFVLLALTSFFAIEDGVPNPRDIEAVAHSLTRDADGTLVVAPTEGLAEILRDSPGFWYVAASPEGERVSHGTVPSTFAALAEALDTLHSAHAFDRRGIAQSLMARLADTPAGPMHVMAGNGRAIDALSAPLVMAGRTALPVIGVVALVALIAIPWIIRRQFRGVDAVAARAGTIDADKHGIRLPLEGVPSEIAPLVDAFNNALERLDAGYARQRRFLADAAHELKTPIAILQTRIETSLEGPERARLLLDVARLSTLAEQLLDIERLERTSQAAAQTLDMVALGRRVASDLAPLAIDAGYGLSFETAIPAYPASGDGMAIERAVTNLVQNAIMHGGGRGDITIRIETDGMLEVGDEGPGIEPEHRQIIFAPFHRIRPLDRGSGLGLSLVEEVVRSHNGHVSVGQAPGGGALFRIWIPPDHD